MILCSEIDCHVTPPHPTHSSRTYYSVHFFLPPSRTTTPAAPPTTAISTVMSNQFTPDIDLLPAQTIDVLLVTFTTPPGPDEPVNPDYKPLVLARQLAKQLHIPANLRGACGIGMVNVGGNAMVGAGALGDIVERLRNPGTRNVWVVFRAWVE
jgi:hypothetical protein